MKTSIVHLIGKITSERVFISSVTWVVSKIRNFGFFHIVDSKGFE